jgi:hypothetical protein
MISPSAQTRYSLVFISVFGKIIRLSVLKKIGLVAWMFLPAMLFAQWGATQIGSSTYNSTLRSMAQGVYDHYTDKSFFCFMQDNSDPYVVECNHAGGSHTWGTPQKIITQTAASKYNFPTISILPDRRLVMCFAAPFDKILGFAISNSPADASSWTFKSIDIGRTHVEYPRILVDRRGYIYLFYIHQDDNKAAHKRWYYYVKSEDAGQTWTAPVLAIQRELDDPYGMCELYVGYTAKEPYRAGEPERWWFAYTSSSGFQYEGTHTGADNSANLVDANSTWGSGGSGFTYRWLYNITKGTNSGITSVNATTIVPTNTMDWDTGDKYGVAYHNIYHSHIFVVYFRPDNGHWYDAAHNDLGTDVSRNEMETAVARPYTSPMPPASKDVGYVPSIVVNDKGYPSVEQNNTYYSWNGAQWDTIVSNLTSGDMRNVWFADDKYYMAMNGIQIYNATTIGNWTNVGGTSLPNSHGYSLYGVFIPEGHAQAYLNAHEYNDTYSGFAWGVSAGETQTPSAIVLRSPKPVIAQTDTATVYAYITDKVHGARSRVRTASNSVTLTVENGNATVINATVSVVNGMATFKVVPAANNQKVIVKAASSGLDSYSMDLFVGDTIIEAETVTVKQSSTVPAITLKAYPNPFTEHVKLSYSLPQSCSVDLSVYDMLGRKIVTLVTGNKPAGNYQIIFSSGKYHLKPGVYMARLQTQTGQQSVLLKME